MGKLDDLASIGQSVWLDFIDRSLIDSGALATLVSDGLRGVTSNPTIFENAIAKTDYYDGAIARAWKAGVKGTENLYKTLVYEDIRRAADILRPVFDAAGGHDGFVCLEVNPYLSKDRESTVKEAKKLFSEVGRPNVLIKVAATPEGIEAFRELTAQGYNINVTLIFSLAQYEAVAKAYVEGIEERIKRGGDVQKASSVASLFVSRLDTAMDRELSRTGNSRHSGRFAVDTARLAYSVFKRIFGAPGWEKAEKAGARTQRLLMASSGVKNPAYPDILYVDNLIGPCTVNTLPLSTLKAFLDHGKVAPTLDIDIEDALERRRELKRMGIDVDAVTDRLLADGLLAFEKSWDALMKSIEEKAERLKG